MDRSQARYQEMMMGQELACLPWPCWVMICCLMVTPSADGLVGINLHHFNIAVISAGVATMLVQGALLFASFRLTIRKHLYASMIVALLAIAITTMPPLVS